VLSTRGLLLSWFLLLPVLVIAGPPRPAVPGAQYPGQRIIFTDPLTGREVWRLTTDGAEFGALHQAAGDQSSESRSFSRDSKRIVYAKSGMARVKPNGVYVMDLHTGIETFLAPAPWFASPIFSVNGSDEVYYFDRPGNGPLLVRAVDASSYAVRTVLTLPGADWQEKVETNVDGSYLSVHARLTDGTWRTVIFTPRGEIHPSWAMDGPRSDDGAVWSPTDPRLICAVRNGQGRFWSIVTLATTAQPCNPAHSAWHPNGRWWFEPAYLVDIRTQVHVLPGTGMGPIHPDINPTEASLGTAARVTADDRGSFDRGTGCPRLYVSTLEALIAAARSGNWRVPSALMAVHYSSMETHGAHIHAHWSYDGTYILWTSNTRDLRDGAPPGAMGRGTDLFVVPLAAEQPPAASGISSCQKP
jgi:hypothetical protein